MEEEYNLIHANIKRLLSAKSVKEISGKIKGEWELHEISHIHGMPRNVEFSAAFTNGGACLFVSAKINRQTAKISNIEIREI